MPDFDKSYLVYTVGGSPRQALTSPIDIQRAPTSNDFGEIGQMLLDSTTNSFYILTSAQGTPVWVGVGGGTPGSFSSLTVNPGPTTLNGTTTVVSTNNIAQTIYLHANGGTAETIDIHADQGTGVDALGSIYVHSDVGGVTLASGLAGLQAIRINASNAAGGIDVDSGSGGFSLNTSGAIVANSSAGSISIASTADQVSISTGEAQPDALFLNSTDSAGGIIALSGGDIAQSIYLHADGGTSETIDIHSDQGTGSGTSSSVYIHSDVGGVGIASGLAATNALFLSASNAAGGITLDAGVTPGITFTNGTESHQMLVGTGSPNGVVTADQGSLYVDVAGASGSTILYGNTDGITAWSAIGGGGGGAGSFTSLVVNPGDTTLNGDTTIVSTNDTAQTIYLNANGGTSETIDIHSQQGTGTGTNGSIYIHSDVGGVTLESNVDEEDSIYINANATNGGITMETTGTTSGNVRIIANSDSVIAGSPTTVALEGRLLTITINSLTIAAGAQHEVRVQNTAGVLGDALFASVVDFLPGVPDTQLIVSKISNPAASDVYFWLKNIGGTNLTSSSVKVTIWFID